MADSKDDDNYHVIEGFRIPKAFNAETFRSAVNYKARPDDVFIVTFPKCGTTWTGQIVSLILRHGKPLEPGQFFTAAPFLEMTGAKAAEDMPRPGAIKVHLPYRLTPRSDQAKYIYVTRNPKDTCVSYYHHQKNLPMIPFDGGFDEFFEIFMSGTNFYGDFFDHLLDWYAHRNEPNVLFVTYEELKEDPEAAVMKLASFIDDEKYAEPLRQDPEKLQNVLKYSSLKHMKETINKEMGQVFTMSKDELEKSDLPEGVKLSIAKNAEAKGPATDSKPKPDGSNFVRKGIIGDWKNYFSEEQSRSMDEKLAERLKGTEFSTIWKKYM